MPNYKIIVQYDGTEFFGWQSQPSGNTVQDILTRAILKITKFSPKIIGSGRTDSGVHALGQVANFNLPEQINEYKFMHSLNSVLPDSVAVNSMQEVNENFNARFDATRRSYIYLISTTKSPFYNRFTFHYTNTNKLNFTKLNLLSKGLLGEKDFTSFCKTKSETENKVCKIFDIGWKTTKSLILFKVEANRFLHGMVRTMVGTLLEANNNNYEADHLNNILLSKNRSSAGESVPAKGLFLNKVKYN